MVQHMHKFMLNVTIVVVVVAYYISLTCDEVNNIDNQSWVYVHDYVVQNLLCIPILLSFAHVVARSNVKGFKKRKIEGWVPHCMGIHYIVHQTNFEVQTLSHL